MGYFKPLRRKIGVMTLGLTCVLMAGWVRSVQKIELCAISPAKGFHFLWFSGNQGLQLRSHSQLPFVVALCAFPNNMHRRHEMSFNETSLYDYRLVNANSASIKSLEIRERFDQSSGRLITMIPYWTIVIPLTLFSAWLLLSKPRVAKTPENKPQNF